MIIHDLFSCIPLQISPGVIPSLGLCICKRCILKTEDREKQVSLVAFQAVWWEAGGPTLIWCVLGGCCWDAPRMCYAAGCLHCRQVKEGTLNWVWVLVWSLYCVALGKSSPLSWPQFLPLYNEVALPALTFWNLLKPIMSLPVCLSVRGYFAPIPCLHLGDKSRVCESGFFWMKASETQFSLAEARWFVSSRDWKLQGLASGMAGSRCPPEGTVT